MTSLKEWMDAQWRNPGVRCAGHGVAYMMESGKVVARAGTQRTYLDKETKRRRAKLAMYNEKLRPVILAQATIEMRRAPVNIYDDKGRYISTKQDGQLPHYTWPRGEAAPVVMSVPRKRVPKAKLEQAAAIIAKVPQDELTAFLARFGLSLSLAASIASLDNVEQIARQFLRATL